MHPHHRFLLFLIHVANWAALSLSLPTSNDTTSVPDASFLGLNCKGSSLCGTITDRLTQISTLLNGVPPTREYTNGYNIACQNNLCAFYQSMPSGTISTGAKANELVKGLLDFGCQVCGSNPIFSGNDVSTGQLTVNYVSKPACQGICWN